MLAGNQTALTERSAASDRGVLMVFVDEAEILLSSRSMNARPSQSYPRATVGKGKP